MTLECLERVRLFVGQKVRQDRIAADNSRQNGYREIALKLQNEAAFGEQILRDLASETTNAL